MDYAPFEALLKQAMGLDAASIGASAIEHAVQALIETVVVPETWFFRDREAFAALARMAFEEWLRTRAEHMQHMQDTQDMMRLLSLPCSTGEEPYSMAMALLDAGFPANRSHIDAVDISARALAHARRAVYGRNSFRGDRLDFRERYFEATAQGLHLSDVVQQQVN